EHVERLKKVFNILREKQLYVKPEKCEFAQSKVHFLGHIISQGKIRMDEAKVKAIQEFISRYSAKAAPLTELLMKNKPWVWSKECQGAFKGLKAAISQKPLRFTQMPLILPLGEF
uniref:Reverse transcriptase/retrotransposon-derived protein RNase H-like domain-containing protein n=1 Tax=Solanum lycopersicum TaxID=4081 RepID=A0A3Q7J7R5_SOLLC